MSDMGDSRAALNASGMGQPPRDGDFRRRLGNDRNVVAQDGETININDDPPPPYDDAEASRRLFGRIHATLNAERGGEDEDPTEAESMRKFLLYCLSVDYRFIESQELPASARNKYIEMWNVMSQLRDSHDSTDLTAPERTLLAPYFWKYLYRPCKCLALPVEFAVKIIDRFANYTDNRNRYKGCVYDVLQSSGLDPLAHKFWQDRNILIPRLAENEQTRLGLTTCLTDLARQFYISIDDVNSTIGEGSGGHWAEDLAVSTS